MAQLHAGCPCALIAFVFSHLASMVVGMTNVIEKIILQAPNPEGLYNYHVGCGHA